MLRRAVSIVHGLLGVGLIAAATSVTPRAGVGPLLFAVVLALCPLFIAYQLWKGPTDRTAALIRAISLIGALAGAMFVVYGVFAIQAAERSAAHGGGLLGGFGYFVLAGGVVIGFFSAITLLALRK